jgi:hypothetical protein
MFGGVRGRGGAKRQPLLLDLRVAFIVKSEALVANYFTEIPVRGCVTR